MLMAGLADLRSDLAAATELWSLIKELCALAQSFPPNTAGIDNNWVYDPNAYDRNSENAKFNLWKASNQFRNNVINFLRTKAPLLKRNPLLKSGGSSGSGEITACIGMDPSQIPSFIAQAYLKGTDPNHGRSFVGNQALATFLSTVCSCIDQIKNNYISQLQSSGEKITTQRTAEFIKDHPAVKETLKSLLEFAKSPAATTAPTPPRPRPIAKPRPPHGLTPPTRHPRPPRYPKPATAYVPPPGSTPPMLIPGGSNVYFCNGEYTSNLEDCGIHGSLTGPLPECTDSMLATGVPCTGYPTSTVATGPASSTIVAPASWALTPPGVVMTTCADGSQVPPGEPCRYTQIPLPINALTPPPAQAPYGSYCYGTINQPGVGVVPARWSSNGAGMMEFQLPNNPAWYSTNTPAGPACNMTTGVPRPAPQAPDYGIIGTISKGGSDAGAQAPVEIPLNGLGALPESNTNILLMLGGAAALFWLVTKKR